MAPQSAATPDADSPLEPLERPIADTGETMGDTTATILDMPTAAALGAAENVLCWPDLIFDRQRVVELGAPAECWTAAGELWQCDVGVFYLTVPGGERRRRVIQQECRVPDGPWVHLPDCECAACRVALPVLDCS